MLVGHARSHRRLHASRAPTHIPAVASLALLAALAGCAGSPATNAAGLSRDSAARPMVARSAVESGQFEPVGASPTLRFFDELETRGLACHDDALECVLLLANAPGAASFDQRVQRCVQLGLLDADFNRPQREAVTVGEVGLLVARTLRPDQSTSAQAAVDQLVAIGALPPTIRPYQGITGAQLLSVIGHAADVRLVGAQPASLPDALPQPATPAQPDQLSAEPLPTSLPGTPAHPN